MIGAAKGEERGDTFNWTYHIDLPVPDGTLAGAFDDWMWKLSDTRVLNRAYMKKYGVDIGEVQITFEKVTLVRHIVDPAAAPWVAARNTSSRPANCLSCRHVFRSASSA